LPGYLGLDFLYLAELLILQDLILPQVFGHKLFIDLLTPWLVMVFVFRAPWRMFTVAAGAVLLLETHSGFPRGLFACLYWILGVFLFYVRHHISWASFLPWALVFSLSQVLVVGLKSVSYWTLNFNSTFLIQSLLSNLVGISLSTIFGLFVIYKSRLDTLEEQRLARS
jgi:hypothetical protein